MRGSLIALVTTSLEGHRASYVELFSGFFDARVLPPHLSLVTSSAPVFFLSIEEAFGLYCIVSLIRSILGRRTVGLLFRPMPALLAKSLRLRLKNVALRLLRALPSVTTLTIVPCSVEPRFAKLVDGWIYDPQLWDLPEGRNLSEGSRTSLGTEIAQAANGRLVLCAVGIQDRRKGFDHLAAAYAQSAELRSVMLFASAGKIAPELGDSDQILSRNEGLVIDRFITDAELLDVYEQSDLVWCLYAKDYDQASGIFGRAVQTGVTPVVRRGSLVHRQCVIEGLHHIAVDEDDVVEQLLSWKPPTRRAESRVQAWRQHSLDTLRDALGTAP